MENFDKVLEEHILEVFDNTGKKIDFQKKEIGYFKAKFSSTGKKAKTVFLDGEPLINFRTNKYRVRYKCLCGNISTIHLSKYLSKERLTCNKCRETEEKIAWHKLYFEMRRNGKIRGTRKLSDEKKVVYNFEIESKEFKENYFRKKLTIEEFDIVLPHIYSVDGILLNGKKIEFIPYAPSRNSKKYTQHILIDGEEHSLDDINLKCQCCGHVFHITRPLKEKINAGHFLCKACAFVNLSFARKEYRKNLLYQSQEELQFIKHCDELNLKVENGNEIPYIFKGSLHIYYPDFIIPQKKVIVEIKDNHVWHKKQVESGKWSAKENAAREYCKQNGFEFYLLFPDDTENFFKNIQKR